MLNTSRKRWSAAVALVALVAIVATRLSTKSHPPVRDSRYPELATVDKDLKRALREAWPTNRHDEEPGHKDAFRRLAHENGADAARSIFAILLEKYGTDSGSDSYGGFSQDENREVVGWILGELADDSVRGMMIRALPERDFHPAFRRALIVALTRPGSAIEPLLERVMDRQEDNAFRRRILVRLPRLGIAPPKRLRELLDQPFEDIDVFAAATLARMGDSEAPSLVLEGIEQIGRVDGTALHHLVLAAEAITGEDIRFDPSAGPPYGRDYDEWRRRRSARISEHVSKWLQENAPDTEFERTRRAYRASDQRRRETSLKKFEDVLTAGDDFDLAAASILLTGYRAVNLDRLARLSRFIARQLDGVSDPGARIEALNRSLLQRRVTRTNIRPGSHVLSYIPYVLGQDAGNCVGYSTLYLALAERLDLPLHGVCVPGHMFIRYDDGSFRRNIETTDLGSAIPDEQYGAGPVLLRNRSKREVLSVILGNYSATCLFYRDYEGAFTACEQALRLDPGNHAALANYSMALFESGSDDQSKLFDLLEALREQAPEDADPLLRITDVRLDAGELELALQAADEAVRLEDSPRTRAAKARCLLRRGRLADARACIGPNPKSAALRSAELELLLREAPDSAEEIVRARMPEGDAALGMLANAAEALLRFGADDQALLVLDLGTDRFERKLKDEFIATGGMVDADSFHSARHRWVLVRAKTLHSLGRTSEAREALAKAEEMGIRNRLLLQVEKLLR